MPTPEEILEDYCTTADQCMSIEDVVPYDKAVQAMNVYAQQEASDFAEWVGNHAVHVENNKWDFWYPNEVEDCSKTTDELYQLFKQQKP